MTEAEIMRIFWEEVWNSAAWVLLLVGGVVSGFAIQHFFGSNPTLRRCKTLIGLAGAILAALASVSLMQSGVPSAGGNLLCFAALASLALWTSLKAE